MRMNGEINREKKVENERRLRERELREDDKVYVGWKGKVGKDEGISKKNER